MFELANCQNTLLSEIADKEMKLRDVALTYGLALRQKEETIDWKAVNQAIMDRWSRSALEWIKKSAWTGKFD